jgi:hypothetical protein
LKKQLKKVRLNLETGADEETQLKEVGSVKRNYFTQIPIDARLRPKSV